ncbi:MAG: hypothetical protein EBU70_07805 [Actinobacteria bacterium]|nr:hypothetical protein [Actinomycetota bacterium]
MLARGTRHVIGPVAAILLAAATTAATTGTRSAEAAAPGWLVSAQTFNVGATKTWRFVVDADRGAAGTDAVVRVEFHPPVASRSAVAAVAAGTYDAEVLARVDEPLEDARLASAGGTVVSGTLPTPVRARGTGVFPVTVSIVDGARTVARETTLINVYGDVASPLGVAVTAAVSAPPSVRADGQPSISDESVASLARLTGLLGGGASPVSVLVPPHLLSAYATVDAAGATRLAAALSRHVVLIDTYVPFDPSSAQRAGLGDRFGDLLFRGETQLESLAGPGTVERSTWYGLQPLDRDGVTILSRNGVSSVVLSAGAAARLSQPRDYLVPVRALGRTSAEGNDVVAVRMVDPAHAAYLDDGPGNPVVRAYALAADLIVQHDEIVAAGDDPSTRYAVLARTDGLLAESAVVAPLLVAIDRAPQLELVGLSSLRGDATTTIELPRTDAADLGTRSAALTDLETEVRATSAMTPADDPRRDVWTSNLLAAMSSTMTDAEFDAYVRDVRAELRQLRQQVKIPGALTFTLGGRESDLRLQVRNDSSTPLSVLVAITSAKLQLPAEPRLVTIPANASSDVVVPVVARANGTFPIDVLLLTPDGAVRVGRPVTLTARVSAIAGLGQVVSGAAALILASWWVSHWRNRRRDRTRSEGAGLGSAP